MKICPKCSSEHNMKGIYCTRKCANSRTFTEEAKLKKSEANKKAWNALSKAEQEQKKVLLSAVSPGQADTYLHTLMTQDWDVLGLHSRRLRVILEQNGKCNKCNITHWFGQPITLEYEHKDGDKTNNTRSNVEGLCPNCHSLTLTWRGRKNKGRQKRVEKFIEMKELL